MNENTNRHSCRTCIWNDQCEDEQPCAFYDDGRYESMDLTDKELETLIQRRKLEFRKEFDAYLKDYYNERLCKYD